MISFVSWPVRKVKCIYTRVTLSRITLAFFLFSFVHCFAQGIIQSLLFSIDAEYSSILSDIQDLPDTPSNCDNIFSSRDFPYSPLNGNVFVTAIHNSSNYGQIMGVNLSIPPNPVVFLDHICTEIMVYPNKCNLQDSRREDLALVFFQFWLLSISLMAIMFDSVPHILAVLGSRVILTAWSAYSVWRTNLREGEFRELMWNQGTPCSVNIFPEYFPTRRAYEIPDLILNCTALVIASYLSWTLLRVYNAQSFKHAGAPAHVYRINRFFMAVLACLQLEVFALTATMALWMDTLLNTAIRELAAHSFEYFGLLAVTAILLLPWIALGWHGIRKENKRLMGLFLFLTFCAIVCWSMMFYSIVFRWTFLQWPFLGCCTVASFILLFANLILGTICWLNFGKGLAEYLRVEDTLSALGFTKGIFAHDEEKGAPTGDYPILPYEESREGLPPAGLLGYFHNRQRSWNPQSVPS
ncbi:hypothetical protein BD779DRAFT_1516082 [Infundibulicybe gibba]|nr:hypothetical protein BD779DRAFT_1516082 [Infundibulicybe gibba]